MINSECINLYFHIYRGMEGEKRGVKQPSRESEAPAVTVIGAVFYLCMHRLSCHQVFTTSSQSAEDMALA